MELVLFTWSIYLFEREEIVLSGAINILGTRWI